MVAESRALIIFDYDDTLLPTTFIGNNALTDEENSSLGELRYRSRTNRLESGDITLLNFLEQKKNRETVLTKDEKERLENSFISAINMAKQFGTVGIITNAEKGWVELSTKKYIPKVASVLKNVQIISAKSKFKKNAPTDPIMWKFYAIEEYVRNRLQCPANPEDDFKYHVISIGDSNAERTALNMVSKKFGDFYSKSVKFRERPSIPQLTAQLEIVVNSMKFLCNHDGHLDLMMDIS